MFFDAIMKILFVLVSTFLVHSVLSSPAALSSKDLKRGQRSKEKIGYSTNQPNAVYSKGKLQGNDSLNSETTEQTVLCMSNRSELFNFTSTDLNATALNNSSNHRCFNSSNATEPPPKAKELKPLTLSNKVAIAAFIMILIIGVFGNAYVIYTFGYTFKKQTATETMLIYLAFVDMFASLVNPLLYIYWIMTGFSRWDFGVIGCKILPPVGPISTTASSAIIIIICIDRYRSIVTPFKSRFSQIQVHILCSLGILSSVAFYSYYISALSLSRAGKCQVQEVNSMAYSIPNITITLLWDVAYVIVFIPTNIRIFMHLRVSKELQSDLSYWEKRKRANRKVMRILLTVGVTFAILVFPKDILHLAFTLSWMFPPGIDHTPLLLSLNSWFKVLQVSNSCVNVFIYSKMHKRFRSEMTNFFRRLLRKPTIRLENESSEEGTNISMEYSEAANGGLLRKISGKLASKFSPRSRKRLAANENGELASLTPSPRVRKAEGNGAATYAKKGDNIRLLSNGKLIASSPNGSILERGKKSDKRLLLNDEGLRHDQQNFDSEDEGFIRRNVYNREPRIQNENMRRGLMRINQYSQNGCGRYENNHSIDNVPVQLSPSLRSKEINICDGNEVAKMLENHKKSGIKSQETNC